MSDEGCECTQGILGEIERIKSELAAQDGPLPQAILIHPADWPEFEAKMLAVCVYPVTLPGPAVRAGQTTLGEIPVIRTILAERGHPSVLPPVTDKEVSQPRDIAHGKQHGL